MKLETLTKDQEELMFQTSQEWIDLFNNTKKINRTEFEKGINWLYQDLLKIKKPKILYCKSWLECLLTIVVFKELENNTVGDTVRNTLRDTVENTVKNTVWDTVRNTVWNTVWDKVENTVWNTVRNTVWDTVENTVRNTIWDKVWDKVGDKVENTVGNALRDTVWDTVWDKVGNKIGYIVWDTVRNTVRNTVWDTVWDTVRNTVRNTVWDTVENTVENTVGDTVRDTVRNTVENTVGDTVRDTVRNTFRNTVGDTVENTVGNTVGKIFGKIFGEYSFYNGLSNNCGWVSFYDFFEKIGILNNNDFKKYKRLIQAGAFQVYEYENMVFAIEPPEIILRDQQNRLNSIEKMAFSWEDGYGFYYINGFNLPSDLFLKLKENKYTIEEFSKELNEEVKSAIISFIQQRDGEEGVYRFFQKNLLEVDVFVNKKEKVYLEGTTNGMNIGVYTLFKGKINGTSVAYVRCYCPSTDRMFFLGVKPNNTNAKDAIASLYQIPKILVNNIESISRQGEIFSTTFDKITTNKLKNKEFCNEELKNYVSLSGDDYFRLITYEY